MSYISGRVVHDADAHVMETSDWLTDFAELSVKDQVVDFLGRSFDELRDSEVATAGALHQDAAYRAAVADEVMLRKNYRATGAFVAADRPLALDAIGVATQLVFPTACNVALEALEMQLDMDLLYGFASATNRAQVNFCDIDPRLLPVGYVPLADLDRAPDAAREAIAIGARALLIPWACPATHATSHVQLDRVWAQAQEARVPILFHVGAADRVLPPQHKITGLPPEPDFHGGDENFRSISYMAISQGPQQALSMLIFDGVLERFPKLMVGVIELGAVWLPGFLRQLDSAFDAFGRHEERLQKLSLRPSEYLHRQVRVTPYPTEPTGWIVEQAGADMCMFSTDYPHVEGGRNPFGRFAASMEQHDEAARDKFYRSNFEELLGLGA